MFTEVQEESLRLHQLKKYKADTAESGLSPLSRLGAGNCRDKELALLIDADQGEMETFQLLQLQETLRKLSFSVISNRQSMTDDEFVPR